MKKNILTYNDIHSIPTSRMVSNGIIVNDKTVAVMRRIEESLSRLQPMGDDNVRYLWFCVDSGKPDDWGDYEQMKACGDVEDYDDYLKLWKEYVNEDTLWYRISVGYVNDFHYMLISDGDHNLWDIRSARYVHDKGDSSLFKADYSEVMSKIGMAIDQCVDEILKDGGKNYVEFVEANLPYQKRTGTIPRHRLNEILGGSWMDAFNLPKLIDVLETNLQPMEYDRMTLRTYMDLWAKCYLAVYPEKDEKKSSEELFEWYSSKGCEAVKFNLDCKEDFSQWKAENSSFHCLDVVYARVHLWVRKDKTTSKWHFIIDTSSYWNLDEYLTIVEKLYDDGIILEYGNLDKILPILKETDLVEITPSAYRYFQRDGVGSQIALWQIPEERRVEVISNTNWEKQHEVKPNKN